MQEDKLKSWKTFCTINDGVNPWNIVYKIAAGKIRITTRLTTIEKKRWDVHHRDEEYNSAHV